MKIHAGKIAVHIFRADNPSVLVMVRLTPTRHLLQSLLSALAVIPLVVTLLGILSLSFCLIFFG